MTDTESSTQVRRRRKPLQYHDSLKSVDGGSGYFRKYGSLYGHSKYDFMYTGSVLRELKQEYGEAYCKEGSHRWVKVQDTYKKAVSLGLIAKDTVAIQHNQHIGDSTSSVHSTHAPSMTVIEWEEKDYSDTPDMSDTSDEPDFLMSVKGYEVLDWRRQDYSAASGTNESNQDLSPLSSIEGRSGLFR